MIQVNCKELSHWTGEVVVFLKLYFLMFVFVFEATGGRKMLKPSQCQYPFSFGVCVALLIFAISSFLLSISLSLCLPQSFFFLLSPLTHKTILFTAIKSSLHHLMHEKMTMFNASAYQRLQN